MKRYYRIYEIAKECHIKSKDVLELANNCLGLHLANCMSRISAEQALMIKAQLVQLGNHNVEGRAMDVKEASNDIGEGISEDDAEKVEYQEESEDEDEAGDEDETAINGEADSLTKEMRFARRKKYCADISMANDFADALKIKEMLDEEKIHANNRIYDALLCKCENAEQALLVKNMMQVGHIEMGAKAYICLFHWVTGDDRKDLFKELEYKWLYLPTKFYIELIDEMTALDEIRYVYQQMKTGIHTLTNKFWDAILSKTYYDTEFYNYLLNEREQWRLYEKIAEGIFHGNPLQSATSTLKMDGQAYDIGLYNFLIAKDVLPVGDIYKAIQEDGFACDYITYREALFCCMQQKHLKHLDDDLNILYRIYDILSVDEKEKVRELHQNYCVIHGTSVEENPLFRQEISNEIANRKGPMDLAADFNEYIAKLGYIDGLSEIGQSIKEVENHINATEADNMDGMFDLNLAYLQEFLHGRQKKRKMAEKYIALPILLLICSPIERWTYKLKREALRDFLYEYREEDINQWHVSGFMFFKEETALRRMIEKIDPAIYMSFAFTVYPQDRNKLEVIHGSMNEDLKDMAMQYNIKSVRLKRVADDTLQTLYKWCGIKARRRRTSKGRRNICMVPLR